MLQIITFSYKPAAIILFHTKADTPVEGIKKPQQTSVKKCARDNYFDSRLFCLFFFSAKDVNVMLSSEVTAKLTGKCLVACASAFT